MHGRLELRTVRSASRLRRVVVERGQLALGVERGGTAGAGGGDGLAVGVVDQVAAREDAGQVGAGGLASTRT